MIYIEINGTRYPATIDGDNQDLKWDRRHSKSITLEMSGTDAAALFVDGLAWSIVMDVEQAVEDPETGEITNQTVQETYDNSEFSLAGPITDNRDGTVTVKMGKPTEAETLRAALDNAITQDELSAAYAEGVNSL